jgi:hypothetical protein
VGRASNSIIAISRKSSSEASTSNITNERGAILRDFDSDSPAAKFFKRSDIEKGIYLAYLQGDVVSGRRNRCGSGASFRSCRQGRWRTGGLCRDLEKGPVAVALCKQNVYDQV